MQTHMTCYDRRAHGGLGRPVRGCLCDWIALAADVLTGRVLHLHISSSQRWCISYALRRFCRCLFTSPLLPTPNLPSNIIPTNIAWLKISVKLPMAMRIPPLKHNIMLESNPLRSTILVGRLAIQVWSLRSEICLSGKDKGGPSKDGFLNDMLFAWIVYHFLNTYH